MKSTTRARDGVLKFEKPLTFFCYAKVNKMAINMENDPLLITTQYVLWRELEFELGEANWP